MEKRCSLGTLDPVGQWMHFLLQFLTPFAIKIDILHEWELKLTGLDWTRLDANAQFYTLAQLYCLVFSLCQSHGDGNKTISHKDLNMQSIIIAVISCYYVKWPSYKQLLIQRVKKVWPLNQEYYHYQHRQTMCMSS